MVGLILKYHHTIFQFSNPVSFSGHSQFSTAPLITTVAAFLNCAFPFVPGILLETFSPLSYIILTTLQDGPYYLSFTEKEPWSERAAWMAVVQCQESVEPGLWPRPSHSPDWASSFLTPISASSSPFLGCLFWIQSPSLPTVPPAFTSILPTLQVATKVLNCLKKLSVLGGYRPNMPLSLLGGSEGW